MIFNRYRIDYRQSGKNYSYFIVARTVERAELVFSNDTYDELPLKIMQIVNYGAM